jgi:hypothetical protein
MLAIVSSMKRAEDPFLGRGARDGRGPLRWNVSAVINSREFADLVKPVLCINQTHRATA